jgi:hypothetical protein
MKHLLRVMKRMEKKEDEDEQDQSSSSSPSEDEGGEAEPQQKSDQIMESSIDLSVSPTDPDETSKGTNAAHANRPSLGKRLKLQKQTSLKTLPLVHRQARTLFLHIEN